MARNDVLMCTLCVTRKQNDLSNIHGVKLDKYSLSEENRKCRRDVIKIRTDLMCAWVICCTFRCSVRVSSRKSGHFERSGSIIAAAGC